MVDNIGPNEISPRGLKMLARVKPETLPLVSGNPRLGVPYVGIGKFVAIGLNYTDHAKEAGLPIPTEPIVFMKATTCISGPNDDVIQPQELDQARLGSRARHRHRHQGAVRDARTRRSTTSPATASSTTSPSASSSWRPRQWDKGKGFDTFGPIGPWLVTTDEITDPQTLDMWLDVNGKRMQSGNTRTMIFGCAQIVSYVSQYMTLMPGDIITTGTPPGVGLGMKPTPVFLKPGDVMTLGIQGLGEQRQKVVAYSGLAFVVITSRDFRAAA